MKRKKKSRKTDHCLNCQTPLKETDNYCPNCGQQNKDNYVSATTLLSDFVSNYFSLDSRFGRTWAPFILKPGKVTNEFNEGKRVKYANPIRWYLVISLIHFFLLSLTTDDSRNKNARIFETEGSTDSVSFNGENQDNITISDQDSLFGLSDKDFEVILGMDDQATEDEIMDSLNMENRPFISRLAARQTIRVNQSSTTEINGYILQKIPIVIFFLLPVYAFLLKVFFWNKGLYIKHLILSIHIHSFLFLLLSVFWLLEIFGISNYDLLPVLVFIISSTYIFISFRNVYKQAWHINLIKLFGTGFLYSISVVIFLILGILISLLLF